MEQSELRSKIFNALELIERGNAFVFENGRRWVPLKEIPDGLVYLARNNCIRSIEQVDNELIDLD